MALIIPPETLAGALTLEHTGKTVTVKGGGASVTGVLVSVLHTRQMIDDSSLFAAVDDPQYVPGRASTKVVLIPDLELRLNPDSIVEVQA